MADRPARTAVRTSAPSVGSPVRDPGAGRPAESLVREWAAPVGLGVVVLALGAWRLGDQSYRFDEAFTADVATRLPVPAFLETLGHELAWALYYLILRAWATLGTNEVALRGLSVVVAAVSVPVLYRLGRETHGRRVALVACTLLALNAFYIDYAQEARVYALAVLATLILMLALLWADRGPSKRKAVWVAAALLALYLHVYTGFVVVAQGLWLAAGRRLDRGWLAAFTAVGIGALPLAAHLAAYSGLAWIPAMSRNMFLEVLSNLAGSSFDPWVPAGDPTMLLAYLALAAIGAAVLVPAAPRRTGKPELRGVLLGWAVPALLSPALSVSLPLPVAIAVFLGLTLFVAIAAGIRRGEGRPPDILALAASWMIPPVACAGLLALGPSPGRLAAAVAVAIAAGVLLVRLRGGWRWDSPLMPIAVGWLPALVFVTGLAIVRPAWLLVVAVPGLFLLALIALHVAWSEREARDPRLLVALWWVTPLAVAALVSLWRPLYIGRYFAPIVPAWALLTASGLLAIRWRPIQALVAVGLAVAGLASLAAMYDRPIEDFRSAAAFLRGELVPGDRVVAVPAGGLLLYPLGFYLGSAPAELIVPAAPADARAALVDTAAAGHRIWLVVGASAQAPEVAHVTTVLEASFERQDRVAFGTLRLERWEP